jgi:hypothetical protein
MWEHHNGALHNPASPAALREHARLDALITLDYDNTCRISCKDRRWFRRPRAVLFTETLQYKLQWLESVKLARARYDRRRHLDLTRERKAMRTYLCRKPSTK